MNVTVGIYSGIVRQYPSRYACARAIIKALLDDEELQHGPLDLDNAKEEFRLVRCQVYLSKADDHWLRQIAAEHGCTLSYAARQGLRPLADRFVRC